MDSFCLKSVQGLVFYYFVGCLVFGKVCFNCIFDNVSFFQVLPASAHVVKATASKFLLDWLSQHEHEYRQWSAAISLGVISSCLHLTDHKQKFENINALLEV